MVIGRRQGLINQIFSLERKVNALEERLAEQGYRVVRTVQSEIKKNWTIETQRATQFGLFLAFCVDTIDPLKLGRVRYFSPLFHKANADIDTLPFANPISTFGGFDDCGSTWVPPAGSTLCITFENGYRKAAFYHD